MKRSGYTDLPLHGGRVPAWLHTRMASLSAAIIEAMVYEFGPSEVLTRLSDPFWFQSFGAVLGMDWHSSGITTSVVGALKKSLAPKSHELGIYVCGGRGRHSRKTPEELRILSDRIGLNGTQLIKASKLSAKVDNTAIQDGFQLYLHSFFVTSRGEWTVVQQGMNPASGYARRYHWHSPSVKSFVDRPHTAVVGKSQGQILNLTAQEAEPTREKVLEIGTSNPNHLLPEVRKLRMPAHHDIRLKDFDLKRLGTVINLAQENEVTEFENLLMTPGLGPRTLQALTLVSEIIYGTPSRFNDPARFAFAHGGKDGHPFPVPLKVYDQTISVLDHSLQKAKIGHSEKIKALKRLHRTAEDFEKYFTPNPSGYQEYLKDETSKKKLYGGRTVMDDRKTKNKKDPQSGQLSLFE